MEHKSSCSVGITGILFIVFLILKLIKVIDWSWWWVTAPLWGEALLVILILAIAGIVVLVKET